MRPRFLSRSLDSCHATRQARLATWLDHQKPWWRQLWQHYTETEQAIAWQADRAWSWYHPAEFEQWREHMEPHEYAALAMVRSMVDERAIPFAENIIDVGELVALAVSGTADTAAPQARPEPVRVDPWSHTLRNPANRLHTLGHHLQHKGVTDAASALGRKKLRN